MNEELCNVSLGHPLRKRISQQTQTAVLLPNDIRRLNGLRQINAINIIFSLTLFLFFLGGIANNAMAANPADLPGSASDAIVNIYGAKKYDLTPLASIFEDKSGRLSIHDVISSEFSSKFERAGQSTINLGYTSSTFWLKLRMKYPEGAPNFEKKRDLYLEMGRSQLDLAEIYIFDSKGDLTTLPADIRKPYSSREIEYATSVFPVSLLQGEEKTIYLRVRNSAAFYLPLTLWSPAAFAEKVTAEKFLFGIYYGGMLAMIFYNFFIFISVKDVSYAYYICYLISVTLFELIEFGHGVTLIEDGANIFHKRHIPAAVWAGWITATLFTQHFLDIKYRHPRINWVLDVLLVTSVANIFISYMTDIPTSILSTVIFSGVYLSLVPVLGIYVWSTGNRNAAFYTYAWLFNAGGLLLYATVAIGISPPSLFFVVSAPAGTLIEAILLSFALADRIKRLRRESIIAKKVAVKNLILYRSIFENTTEGLYYASLQGRILNANPALIKMLGFASLEKLKSASRSAMSMIYSDISSQYGCLFEQGRLQNEVAFRRPDGKEGRALHSAQLILDMAGEPTHIEGSFADITESLERDRAQRERLLERRDKELALLATAAKSEFLRSMSYNIRTPLTAIIGFGESLRLNSLDDVERKRSVDAVHCNSQKLLILINNILDFSKIDANKMPVENIKTDVCLLVESVRSDFEKVAVEKEITITENYHYPIPGEIWTDPTRLKQLLFNLCASAIKFSEKGSILIEVEWDDNLHFMKFSVSDTGSCIPEESLRNIFKLLRQSKVELSHELGESGLELALSKRLTELLGGKLEVESTYGKGYCFVATISSRVPQRSEWIGSARKKSDSNSNRKSDDKRKVEIPQLQGKILLAEDNTVNQQLIKRIVAKTGACITVTDNGELAVEIAIKERFDLILMDLNMPVMGGLEATKKLRAAGYAKPIFALTAEQGKAEIDECMNAGCNGHLFKPLEMEMFYSVLSDALTRKKEASPHEGEG